MEIEFKSDRLRKICEKDKKRRQKYEQHSELIVKRINELISAENLYDILKLPQARLHPLYGDRKGCFAVDLRGAYRLILSPLNGDYSNLKTITTIQLIDITNYHK